jgi:sulfide:quinone oxidoreductase
MTSGSPHRAVVAGGGVAGLETVMALRALAGSRVEITLISPDAGFVYRPLSVGEPFGLVPLVVYPLASVAEDFQAELVRDKLESVDPEARRACLASGGELEYDSLVVALGARQYPAWDHVTTFGGSADAERIAELVRGVERGEVTSVAFVVPRGVTWPLPIYELALMTAGTARRARASAEIAIFTPEAGPLAVFGREASSVVAAALEAAGVQIARGVTVDVTPQNDLVIPSEETPMRFEQVVAAPLLQGPHIPGLPSDSRGFIPIDGHGRIRGLEDVFAAGDGTDFSVKQGGVAAQQAVAVAEMIAQRAGAAVQPRPVKPVLRTRLLTGEGSRFLHAEGSGASDAISEASDQPLWWPSHKIAAAHLAPYLAEKGVLPEPQALDARHGIEEVLVPITEWIEESPYGE